MECTGERYMPNVDGDWTPEHRHRYALAAMLCEGKDVLDVASGEGYGSAYVARTAKSVVGVDISEEAVSHAQKSYALPNLVYRQGSATNLAAAGLAEHSFDVVISFETIEHLHDHDAMLDSLCRVLRPGGLLIISSPDKKEYTDIPNYHNEYHVHELYREEFESLLGARFPHYQIYGQRLEYGSMIIAESSAPFVSFIEDANTVIATNNLAHSMYLIALASHAELPKLPSSLWKYSIELSDFAIRHKKMGEEAQEWIHVLESKLNEQNNNIAALHAQLHDMNTHISDVNKALDDQKEKINTMLQSKSWQITKPLRILSSLLRNIKK